MNIYKPMNNGYCTGVIKLPEGTWAVEPEYTWRQAEIFAAALNKNPDIEPDELYKLVEVKA